MLMINSSNLTSSALNYCPITPSQTVNMGSLDQASQLFSQMKFNFPTKTPLLLIAPPASGPSIQSSNAAPLDAFKKALWPAALFSDLAASFTTPVISFATPAVSFNYMQNPEIRALVTALQRTTAQVREGVESVRQQEEILEAETQEIATQEKKLVLMENELAKAEPTRTAAQNAFSKMWAKTEQKSNSQIAVVSKEEVFALKTEVTARREKLSEKTELLKNQKVEISANQAKMKELQAALKLKIEANEQKIAKQRAALADLESLLAD